MTYIEMNLNQRINYKGSQENKANCFGLRYGLNIGSLRILQSAWEDTQEKAHDFIRTYSTSSRRHFK